MTGIESQDRQWSELVSAVCDGQATESEIRTLGEMLRRDEQARAEYLRMVDMHAALADEAFSILGSSLAATGIGPEVDRPSESRQLEDESHGVSILRSVFSYAALAACVVVALGVAWRRTANDRTNGPIATVLLSEACEWGSGNHSEGERLSEGWLELVSGMSVLRTDAGAELVLAGPGRIHLSSARRVRVEYGDLVVRAEGVADGFIVETPTSEVVDLGTEFAVKVVPSGATEVHVMDGEVSYRGTNAGNELSAILHAGEGVAIDANGVPRAVPMNSPRFQDFVRQINPRSRSELLTAYEGFNYSPGRLRLDESTVGIGWSGPWRRRLPKERRSPSQDDSPAQFEIVHGKMEVTWPVPGGRLGMLKLAPGNVYYVRPLTRAIDLGRDEVTYFSLMVREIERPDDWQPPREHLRLTFRSSSDYFGDVVSFGHGPRFLPRVQAGQGNLFTSPFELPAEQTTLWIGKILSRSDGEDEVYFRIYGEDDVLGYAEPATWHVVSRNVDSDARLDRVLLSSTGKFGRIVDELRIGPTWRSVAPMSEDTR